jgi:hypothetical protein
LVLDGGHRGFSGENDANWGKHRTEDTEDTEGGLGLDGGHQGFRGENDANWGKASLGGHGGGIWG